MCFLHCLLSFSLGVSLVEAQCRGPLTEQVLHLLWRVWGKESSESSFRLRQWLLPSRGPGSVECLLRRRWVLLKLSEGWDMLKNRHQANNCYCKAWKFQPQSHSPRRSNSGCSINCILTYWIRGHSRYVWPRVRRWKFRGLYSEGHTFLPCHLLPCHLQTMKETWLRKHESMALTTLIVPNQYQTAWRPCWNRIISWSSQNATLFRGSLQKKLRNFWFTRTWWSGAKMAEQFDRAEIRDQTEWIWGKRKKGLKKEGTVTDSLNFASAFGDKEYT